MFEPPVNPYEPVLRGREHEIKLVCQEDLSSRIINIYGEAGIGKTKLLRESKKELEGRYQASVFYVDLESASKSSGNLASRILESLISQRKGNYDALFSQKLEEIASKLVAELNQLAENKRVVIMLDTTEVIQDDMDFWSWMENNLVSPLAVYEKVLLIFAGRVPVPWRRYEVRRTVKTVKLAPLEYHKQTTSDALPASHSVVESGTPAHDLVHEAVANANPQLTAEQCEAIIQLTIDYTFGHPALSLAVGKYLAIYWLPEKGSQQAQVRMAEEVIKPFIDQVFFKTVDELWRKILWWISPLVDFGPIFLRYYLSQVLAAEVEGKTDSFFAAGLTNLRIKHAVIWKRVENEQFHGTIGRIVSRCFQVVSPSDFNKACNAAYQTCLRLVNEFLSDDEIGKQEMLERARYYQALTVKGN